MTWPRIIAIASQKGGVAKPTTCLSLGASLAEQGKSVLMIDLDPQAHLTLSLGLHPASCRVTPHHPGRFPGQRFPGERHPRDWCASSGSGPG